MERGTVHVLSFRDKVRKVGVTIPDDPQEKSALSNIKIDLKAKLALISVTVSSFFLGHRADPPSEHDFGDVTPTQLRSPIVVQRMWDQSGSKYRYCGCIHVKVAAWFGVVLDAALLITYLVIIALVAVDWENARALVDGADIKAENREFDTVSTTVAIDTTTEDPDDIIAQFQQYESYLAATIADASLAAISLACLLFGMVKNRPNFLIPEICLAFVIVGVKIIQMSKQASDGVATPFVISFAIVEIFFSIWFAHVIYLYRRYMKDRNAFLAMHSQY